MTPTQTLCHRFALFLTGCTLLLIAAGGLVTSTESGLSVPDWPLSYGQFFPPMVGGVRFEHSHRVIAGAVGVLTLVLAVLVRVAESRRWLRRLAYGACLLVLAQAVLGGLTVIHLLPLAISVTHACVAQSFLCVIAAIALFTSNEWRLRPRTAVPGSASLSRLVLITTAFLFAQLIAGALLRHRPSVRPDLHILLGVLILIHTGLIALKVSKAAEWGRLVTHGRLLAAFALVQTGLGVASLIVTRFMPRTEGLPTTQEVLTTTAHQTLGATLLMATVLLLIRSYRLFAEPVTSAPARASR